MKDIRPYPQAKFVCRMAVMFCIICVAGSISSNSQSQQPSRQELKQERQQAIDWFINKYYYPNAICAFAGTIERARQEELLKSIRKENLRAIEAAEKTPEYTATVAALQPLIDQRFRGKSNQAAATAECTHLTEQMVFAHKRRRHDDLFELLLKLFAQPT